jgi:protein-S-isoprenylcysteine O-methyltransferase Ste14
MKTLSNVASLLHLAAVAWLLLSGQLLSWSPFAIVPQVLALALAIWARRSFPSGQFSTHPEPKVPNLIETGPYRWLRHPMYTATQAIVWSGVLTHRSPLNLALGAVTLVAVVVRIADEESLLREKIPGYAEYAKRTKRFVPFVF